MKGHDGGGGEGGGGVEEVLADSGEEVVRVVEGFGEGESGEGVEVLGGARREDGATEGGVGGKVAGIGGGPWRRWGKAGEGVVDKEEEGEKEEGEAVSGGGGHGWESFEE